MEGILITSFHSLSSLAVWYALHKLITSNIIATLHYLYHIYVQFILMFFFNVMVLSLFSPCQFVLTFSLKNFFRMMSDLRLIVAHFTRYFVIEPKIIRSKVTHFFLIFESMIFEYLK